VTDATIPAIRRLDVTGTFCPLPILLAAREMMRLATGDRLEIVGDDPGILEDMPVWCERAGHRLVEMTKRGAKIVSLVEKGAGRKPPARRDARPAAERSATARPPRKR
jgi:tRNA 2-thiouridine synthesizing protein A